jgi:hypothetical protein
MRRTMLASYLSALSSLGFVASSFAGDEAMIAIPALSNADSVQVVSNPDVQSGVVTIAANVQLVSSEVPSPSDQIKNSPESIPVPRPNVTSGSNISSPFPYPSAPGPSFGMSSMLRYMNCDPHSCPNIWQGYDAQRAAELARKCTPPSSGCGRGCSCGGLCNGGCQLMPAPDCTSCQRPVNRYRQYPIKPSSGCTSCDAAGTSATGCSACQAQASPTVVPMSAPAEPAL